MKNIVNKLRKENGYTQQNLAMKLNVSRQTIISIENGKYNPSITLAYKIGIIFKKKIEDIFIFEEK